MSEKTLQELQNEMRRLPDLRARLDQLKRYDCSDVWGMEPQDDGDWLKRSDVLAVLASLPAEEAEDPCPPTLVEWLTGESESS